jgi:N-carbamoylputrescine amidase
VREHPAVLALAKLAKALKVVIPISFFERDGPRYYNSVAVADADGEILGLYRKSHIPDGPGYQEKYYFRPGDTGFKAWKTRHGMIGVGICWDQWYPETARAMVLEGAEILFYPTAIGSEPQDLTIDTHLQWQRAMQGHAVANAVPIVAANRIGVEENDGATQSYYGHSFIADHKGELVAKFGDQDEGVLLHNFDLAEIARYRAEWGFFRDRRTDLYAKSML